MRATGMGQERMQLVAANILDTVREPWPVHSAPDPRPQRRWQRRLHPQVRGLHAVLARVMPIRTHCASTLPKNRPLGLRAYFLAFEREVWHDLALRLGYASGGSGLESWTALHRKSSDPEMGFSMSKQVAARQPVLCVCFFCLCVCVPLVCNVCRCRGRQSSRR